MTRNRIATGNTFIEDHLHDDPIRTMANQLTGGAPDESEGPFVDQLSYKLSP